MIRESDANERRCDIAHLLPRRNVCGEYERPNSAGTLNRHRAPRPTRSAARCNPRTEDRWLGLNSNRDIALTDRVTVHGRNRRERIPAA